MNDYILVSVCKNEEKNLPCLAESVINQDIKPKFWLILDDNSSDNTPGIISRYESRYDWIGSIKYPGKKRDLGIHISRILKMVIEKAIEISDSNNIDFEYIGIADADMILQPDYAGGLIKEMDSRPEIGIGGGGIRIQINGTIKKGPGKITEPSGGNMLIRRKCYAEIGGMPFSYSWDSVLKAMARLNGWETRRFEEYFSILLRETSTAEGYWDGYKVRGKSAYFRNIHPFHAIAIGLKYTFHIPPFKAVAYLYGYFKDYLKNEEQIENEEIKKYYWNKWTENLR